MWGLDVASCSLTASCDMTPVFCFLEAEDVAEFGVTTFASDPWQGAVCSVLCLCGVSMALPVYPGGPGRPFGGGGMDGSLWEKPEEVYGCPRVPGAQCGCASCLLPVSVPLNQAIPLLASFPSTQGEPAD